jgi:hypothetical protein
MQTKRKTDIKEKYFQVCKFYLRLKRIRYKDFHELCKVYMNVIV